jgi:hypothetical protein
MKVLRVLSSRTTNWKSARLHGGMMLQSLSVPLQNGFRFFQSPLPAIPSAFLTDAPAPQPGRNVGFTMLGFSDMNESVPAFHTGSLECPCVPSVRGNNRLHCRFWPEPVSIFGSLGMTVPMAVHLRWTFHSACPSNRIDARSCRDRLTVVSSSQRRRDVVSVASDSTVTSRAGTNRLPRTEPWVRLTNLFSYRTITVTSSLFHTHALPLPGGRFLCPRIGRGAGAERLRNMNCLWPLTRPFRELKQPPHRAHKRIVRVRGQSADVINSWQQARSQAARIRDGAIALTVCEPALVTGIKRLCTTLEFSASAFSSWQQTRSQTVRIRDCAMVSTIGDKHWRQV